MKPPLQTPEQLLKQLEENSAGLIRADLKLKASSQHRDELARNFDKQMAFTRRMEQLIILLLAVCFIAFCFILHLFFPHWLPEQWAALTSFIKHL